MTAAAHRVYRVPVNELANLAALNVSPRVLSWIAAMAEALTVPLLLLHADGRLLNANAAGYRELARAKTLVLQGSHVLPVQEVRRNAFIACLAATCNTRTRQSWQSAGADYPIILAPVAALATQACTMLMVVMHAETSALDACRLFAYQYGLTPAELAVLHALCQGKLPRQIAAARGVTSGTVRRQMACILRKSGEDTLGTLMPRLTQGPPVLPPGPPSIRGE